MNQKLSFANIAREAKVSISYLYKYPEIKKRIQYLRRQQEENAKPVKPQLRTEKSSFNHYLLSSWLEIHHSSVNRNI